MAKTTKFYTLYDAPPVVTFKPDTDTKFVDQSEADRVSLKYQLERYGMDSLLQQFEKTKAQFGYADTRLVKDFAGLCETYAEANGYFQQLPSKIRAEFGHDPIKYYDSIEKNPQNAYEKGFISKDFAKQMGVKFEEFVPPVNDKPSDVVEPVVNTEETSA